MFPVLNPSQVKTRDVIDVDEEEGTPPTPEATSEVKESECYLTSVVALRKAVGKVRHHRECSSIKVTKFLTGFRTH